MKILLLGDYSNVHATLAEGLRLLGHVVTVASDGDGWKNYPRDVDLRRKGHGFWNGVKYMLYLLWVFRQFRGYDVVHLINPIFLPLKAERIWPFYHYLRKNNKSVFLGAYGMDYYWVKAGMDCETFRYSDFNIGGVVRESRENSIWIKDWLKGPKGALNRYIASDCDGIVAGLYEYYASYVSSFSGKLIFIPFPIHVDKYLLKVPNQSGKLKFFIGIQRERNAYKGTDIMYNALKRVEQKYPEKCEICKVESVPFSEYIQLMRGCDVILDQLYSYTPAMNALEAMAQGLVVVGGGEPENYDILGETELKPIVNVEPNEESVYNALCELVEKADKIALYSLNSRLYVKYHHDYVKVAQQYLDFWQQLDKNPA